MKSTTLSELISQLSRNSYADKNIIDQCNQRIAKGAPFLRDEGVHDHFCTFLIPVNIPAQKIFIGHHKKGNSWMPPGGHIDKNESPIETVQREWREELGRKFTSERIELFDISIIHIDRINQTCKTHFDFWHLVHSELHDFLYDKREFYDAGWYEITKAVDMVTHPVYKTVFRKLHTYIFKV